MKGDEEMFKKVFGEALREMSEEGAGARARKVEAVPNKMEVEERKLGHLVFRIVRRAGRNHTATRREEETEETYRR